MRVGGARTQLDTASIRSRLTAGTLAGTDLVVDGGVATPIAAHPSFRAWFLPGHPDAIVRPGPEVSPAPARSRARLFVGLFAGVGGIGLVAAIAIVFFAGGGTTPVAPAPVEPAAPVQAASPSPPVPAPVEPAPVADPGSVHPFDALIERIGPVDAPRAALLARAWADRNEGTAAGLQAAVEAAERAVARAPTDAEALALLGALYAEAGVEPVLRRALVERASARSSGAPVVARAAALVALADGDAATARQRAESCLSTVPGDLGCREALAAVLDSFAPRGSEAENQLYALDQLAQDWPENRWVPRRAALLAARADLLGAEARLEDEARRNPKDEAITAARALLALRNGQFSRGRSLVGRVTAPDDALLLEAAGEAVARGDGKDALAFLERRKGPPNREALLYETQARVLLARSNKANAAAAVEAADRLAKADRAGPASVQARVGAALAAGDRATATRRWDDLDPDGAPPVDVARAWLSRAVSDIEADHPREAQIALDAAVQADRSDPDVFLWRALAATASGNGRAAVEALRPAVVAIDGRHARRRPYGGALPTPADPAKLRSDLQRLLASQPTLQDELALGVAITDWLAGRTDAALAGVESLAARGGDADALALKARLLFKKGQNASALTAIDLALAQRPREVAWQLLRADILVSLKRIPEAEAALSIARSGALSGASVHLVALRLAQRKGDAAAALAASKAAAAADPTDLVARRALRGVSED